MQFLLKLIFLIIFVVGVLFTSVFSLNNAFANDGVPVNPIENLDYDLSGHPIYNDDFVYENGERNFSSERYSPPTVSNTYHLLALNVSFDPTVHYYNYATSTFDYCDLEQFSKYPKCVAQSILREIHKEDFRIWMESYNPNTSEIDVKQISKLTGISYDSLFPWISNLEMWIAQDKIDSSEMIAALEYLMNQEN